MSRNNFFTTVATLGPIGHLQAPGTFGALCALALVIPLNMFLMGTGYYWPALAITIFLSACIIDAALGALQRYDDPQEIVLDEVAGMIVAFAGVPLDFATLLIGFALFRLLDIFKPFGISYLQNISHSTSVILDDLAAGLITCYILHALRAYQLL